jgi:hypothetical protein
MDHASEYGRKLVCAEEEAAVMGVVRHHASFPPYPDGFLGHQERRRDVPDGLAGPAPAATCDPGREHFRYDNSAGERKPHDPGALQFQTRPDGALTGALPCRRLLWPT